jgi:hypothetical protein
MHLPAGSNSRDPIGAIGYALQDIPNTEDCSFPPGLWTLLRPPKMTRDLIMFFRRKRDNFSSFSDKSRSHTSGSDVNRKQEVLLHETRYLELAKNLLAIREFNTSGRFIGESKICSPKSTENDLFYPVKIKCLTYASFKIISLNAPP